MTKKDYWVEYWQKYGKETRTEDAQKQVLRTINNNPITKELWQYTLQIIENIIEPNLKDKILDLCCGNGLISVHLSPFCQNIVSVDISKDLIKKINTNNYQNIEPIVSDIRAINFEDNSFTKVLIYAGIQYLSYKETILLFENVYSWLKPGGYFFIGDIPDQHKLWEFYNNHERQTIYFQNIKKDKPIIGTWFNADYLIKIGEYAGFSSSVLIPQHQDLIYSQFRFDFKLVK